MRSIYKNAALYTHCTEHYEVKAMQLQLKGLKLAKCIVPHVVKISVAVSEEME